MKKNKMMRMASVLLILVLLTTCTISGTFAKYTTSATASDTARVAYWGFKDTTIESFNLFSANDSGILDNGDGLFAPGSSGSATIDFVYTDYSSSVTAPEVDYTFKIEVTTAGADGTGSADIDKLDANPNFLWVVDGVAYQTFAEFETAIEALDGTESYEAGQLPNAFYNGDDNATHKIGWEWLYGAGDTSVAKLAGVEVTATNQDELDTEMGNADDLDDLKLTITITATQVD